MPMPAANSIADQDSSENSGRESSGPRRMRPKREQAISTPKTR